MKLFLRRVSPRASDEQGSNWFTKSLNHLLDQDYNFLAAIVGRTRGGKSWTALKLAETHDPTFTPETLRDRMVNNVNAFIDNVVADKYPPRCIVIYDEAGADADSKKYGTRPNELLRIFGETYGFAQICILWIAPNLLNIDKDQRRLIHAIIKMHKRGFAQVRKVSSNYLDKEWHYPVGTLTISPPSPEILRAYMPLKIGDAKTRLLKLRGRYIK